MAITLTYTSVEGFKNSVPEQRLGELSNDTDGSFDVQSEVIKNALQWGEERLESKTSVREDLPLPLLNADDSVPPIVAETVYDLAIWKLFKRREYIPDDIQVGYEDAMQFLDDVSKRRATVNVKDDEGDTVDEIDDFPEYSEVGPEKFKNFNY